MRKKTSKIQKYHGYKIDIFVLIGLLILASLYTFVTRGSYLGKPLIVGAIFTLLPAAYLSFRKKKNWSKVITSTLLFGLFFGFLCDFYSQYTKAWDVVSIVIPYKIFGVSTVDSVLGFVMMTFLTVIFYEHFIEHERNHHVSKNIKYAIIPGILLLIVGILIYLIKPTLMITPYPYFLMGIVGILPPIFLAYEKPKMIKNMLETAVYFFCLYFIIELFAVSYSYWIYPGNNYVGWVTIFGLRFPFEELFFWMMLYAATLVSYYELFID